MNTISSLLKGYSRLNNGLVRHPDPVVSKIVSKSPAQALKEDWQNVGNAISKAMQQYEQEQE